MKKRNHLVLGIVVMTVLFVLSMAAMPQHTLDGKWFKVNCQATTKLLNTLTGNFVDYNFGFTAYIYFAYNHMATAPRGVNYFYEVWTQSSPGIWVISTNGNKDSSPFSENFFPDTNMHLFTKSGVSIYSWVTPHACVLPNVFKAGGEIYDGRDSQGRYLFGWLTMKGELATALPFNPI